MKITSILSLAVVVCWATLLAGCKPGEKAVATAEPSIAGDTVTIQTNSPQLGSLTVESVGGDSSPVVSLTGRLTWDEEATVRVFTPFAGIVRKTLAGINESVMKGQPLAEIQSAEFGQAQADARKSASDYRRAERALTRVRDLFEHGAAPGKDLEAAEADEAAAHAEKDRAEARLAIYGSTASASERGFLLPSPLDGVVVERNVTPGQEVRPDQMLANMPQFTAPLFVVTDPARLWIQIDATEADLPRLRKGCEFTFSSRAFPAQTFTGRVETIAEFLDANTRTIKVRGSVNNADRRLKAEMFVSVNLRGDEMSSASVPAKAVFLKGEKHYVFVEEQPGQFARKEVRLGAEQAGRISVVAGLQTGQRVVTEGCVLLQQTLK